MLLASVSSASSVSPEQLDMSNSLHRHCQRLSSAVRVWASKIRNN